MIKKIMKRLGYIHETDFEALLSEFNEELKEQQERNELEYRMAFGGATFVAEEAEVGGITVFAQRSDHQEGKHPRIVIKRFPYDTYGHAAMSKAKFLCKVLQSHNKRMHTNRKKTETN